MPSPSSTPKLICALPTPFHPDFSIDTSSLKKTINAVLKAEPAALLPAGSTGEVHSLSIDEQLQLIQGVSSILQETPSPVPKPLIWAGLFHTHLFPAVQQIEKICAQGIAKALMVITPYYIKPSQQELLFYYQSLADQSPLPIYLYNNPGRTGVDLSIETIKQLALHPNILGIKESALTPERMQKLASIPSFAFFCGNDDQISASISHGADGAVSALAPLAPTAFKKLLYQQKDHEGYKKLEKLLPALTSYPNPQLLKTIASRLNLMQPVLRAPLLPLSLDHAALSKLAHSVIELNQEEAALCL